MSIPEFSDRLIYTVSSGPGDREELLAMREWRICTEKGTGRAILTSLNGQQVWDGPAFESPWAPDQESGPSTGVHGFKRRARRHFWNEDWFYGRRTWAWGWVALSGLVEEYPLGYRAEVAAIRQLRLGPRSLAYFASRGDLRDIAAELGERYQCRVKVGYPEWRVSRTMVPSEER
jgi:hypothetical protein